jgi:hypothetical protein
MFFGFLHNHSAGLRRSPKSMHFLTFDAWHASRSAVSIIAGCGQVREDAMPTSVTLG